MIAIYSVYAFHVQQHETVLNDLGLIIFTILTVYMMLPLSSKWALIAGWTTCVPHVFLMIAGNFWIPDDDFRNKTLNANGTVVQQIGCDLNVSILILE